MQQNILASLANGDIEQALELARQWTAAEPDLAAAHRTLAHVLARSGDIAAALVALDQAAALAPEDAGVHHDRALLLVREGDTAAAQAALGQTLGLDPNHLPAYLAQARLAIGLDQLDEATRLLRTASRIDPDHPQLLALDGLLALRLGNHSRALVLATSAAKALPDDPQVLSVMGFAHAAQGQLAFAEQAFRRVAGLVPDARPLQPLLARLVAAQGRADEAAALMEPLLDEAAAPTPALLRVGGIYALQGGRHDQARQWLGRALDARPGDTEALRALMALWAGTNDQEDARATLERLLQVDPSQSMAWAARVALEQPATAAAAEVLARWQAAMPGHVPALEAAFFNADRSGDLEATRAAAARLLEVAPEHPAALQFQVESQLAEDPDAALAQARQIAGRAPEGAERDAAGAWIGRMLDRVGRTGEALAQWQSLHDAHRATRVPLPELAPVPEAWPALAAIGPDASRPLLLWGAPGSGVERVVDTLAASGARLLTDRFRPNPPQDHLQSLETGPALAAGRVAPDQVVASWRKLLPARGVDRGQPIDWLLHWDNALLLALRPHLPGGCVMVALRDPRDMLLDWLSTGAVLPLQLASADEAARWLAAVLGQIADLRDQELYPYLLLPLDGVVDDPVALATALGQALGAKLQPAARVPRRLPAGRWRAYAGDLAGAFATLTPVAVRLGYAEA